MMSGGRCVAVRRPDPSPDLGCRCRGLDPGGVGPPRATAVNSPTLGDMEKDLAYPRASVSLSQDKARARKASLVASWRDRQNLSNPQSCSPHSAASPPFLLRSQTPTPTPSVSARRSGGGRSTSRRARPHFPPHGMTKSCNDTQGEIRAWQIPYHHRTVRMFVLLKQPETQIRMLESAPSAAVRGPLLYAAPGSRRSSASAGRAHQEGAAGPSKDRHSCSFQPLSSCEPFESLTSP
jgi:hypothetical protein